MKTKKVYIASRITTITVSVNGVALSLEDISTLENLNIEKGCVGFLPAFDTLENALRVSNNVFDFTYEEEEGYYAKETLV